MGPETATLISARSEISPETVRDEVQRQYEHYAKLLSETMTKINELEMSLAFQRGLEETLARAMSSFDSFLGPGNTTERTARG